MVATVTGGGVYLSTDSGTTWNAIAGVESKTWNSISCDANCSNFAISSIAGNLYLLSKTGEKIADASNTSKWTTVTLNSLGSQIIAGAVSGSMRRSINTGANWALVTNVAL
jgi:mannosyltransferase OCH1-like enzyme